MKSQIKMIIIALTLALSASCSTIMGTPTQLMSIESEPDTAKVIITDEKGKKVFKGATPTSVTLEKSDGTYWGGKEYVVEISKAGYKNQKIIIKSKANAWYIGGNFLFGGLIGWFIVDPMNGHMYNLTPEQIEANLSSDNARNNQIDNKTISIVLLEDVPSSLRKQMKRIY